MEHIQVKKIDQWDERTLAIVWNDDRESRYDVVELRKQCPCAHCIDEWSGEQRLLPEQVADDIRPIRIDSVGRYALTIQFSDGHTTGIYSFSMLRSLDATNAKKACH